jgi:hypothetical protein
MTFPAGTSASIGSIRWGNAEECTSAPIYPSRGIDPNPFRPSSRSSCTHVGEPGDRDRPRGLLGQLTRRPNSLAAPAPNVAVRLVISASEFNLLVLVGRELPMIAFELLPAVPKPGALQSTKQGDAADRSRDRDLDSRDTTSERPSEIIRLARGKRPSASHDSQSLSGPYSWIVPRRQRGSRLCY